MKQTLKKIAAVLLAAALCIPALYAPPAKAARVNSGGQIMVRIGLASTSSATSNTAREAAHLENSNGAGYRFGYYDSNLNFIEWGRTDSSVTQVAVVKTVNLCYGRDYNQGKDTYSSAVSSKISVGCYHIIAPGTYSSYAAAAADAAKYEGGFPAYIDGAFQVRVGAYTSEAAASSARSALGLDGWVIDGTSSAGMSVVKTGTSQVLFQFDDASQPLAILPDVTGAADPYTWYSGNQYRGGFTYQRVKGGNITVVNVLDVESYVRGVAPYEMGRSWPLEALKTQATCARTYVLTNLNAYGSLGFDVSNTSYSQVYNGLGSGASGTGPSEISDQACAETRGIVVKYNGKLATTPYSSSHGGASEDAKNVWGTDTVNTAPYLKGVIDPYEAEVNDRNSMSPWTVSYSAAQLTAQVQKYGYGVGTSVQSITLTYSPNGNVIELVLNFANGKTNTIKASGNPNIRSVLGLRSIRFTANGQTVSGGTATAFQEPPASNPPAPTSGGVTPPANQAPETPETPGTTTPATGTGSSITVNGSQILQGLSGAYTISGSGTVSAVNGAPYTITGTGDTIPMSVDTTSAAAKPATGVMGARDVAPQLGTVSSDLQEQGIMAVSATGEVPMTSGMASTGVAAASTGSTQVGSGKVTITGSQFVFNGGGWGHQVGMSQYGAYAMARKGFTYDQIIRFYFPGTEVVAY